MEFRHLYKDFATTFQGLIHAAVMLVFLKMEESASMKTNAC